MHDINGKALHIGSSIYSVALGLLIIKSMKEEHNRDMGGALIECIGVARGGGSVEIRTHEHKVTLVRTWKEMATEALQVQDACNLSGVVISFSHIIQEVRIRLESEGKGGTEAVNTHPVCVLFSDKVAHLTDTQFYGHRKVAEAYMWAHDLTEPSKPVVG